jgi:hypothetical protein
MLWRGGSRSARPVVQTARLPLRRVNHRAVVHFAKPQRQRIQRNSGKASTVLGALLRKNRAGSQKISRSKVHHRLFDNVRVALARNAGCKSFASM